jgi:4-carboxymuconolactone decarboxylase
MIGAGDAHSRRNRSEVRKIRLLQARQHGDIWERPGLSKRDRSLIVIASLISTYRPEQLRGHLARALDNGVTQDEIAEVSTHLACYSGWPASMTAARLAKEVFEERVWPDHAKYMQRTRPPHPRPLIDRTQALASVPAG